ncbi:hypothetical protein RhiirA4_482801 [Rhizophagus irregularis]|uniref:Uncharacterized protein n=1 Tax=Rhizophagus irregularis TaxID=588596 RepID=A0A2I1HLP0_9GLOM|nr:hypothetical protein RhiirA4_482801 [Rhizophagus irregularis]
MADDSYYHGYGTIKNEKLANNGNIAMYELGLCNKAFELFKQSIRRGYPGGMMLGYCYDEGIGTEIRWNCKRCQ